MTKFMLTAGGADIDKRSGTFQLIPNAELAVIPDAGHFVVNAEQQKVLPTIEGFLDAPKTKISFATTLSGYHPGETR